MFDVEKQTKSLSVNEIAIHMAMLALTPMPFTPSIFVSLT
jgi:hypothetical protein